MKKIYLFYTALIIIFLTLITDISNAFAKTGSSSQWTEGSDIYCAYADTSSTNKEKIKELPCEVEYDSGYAEIFSEKVEFTVKADSTLGAKYTSKFDEAYKKVNTGREIVVKHSGASYILGKGCDPAGYKIVVKTPGYKVKDTVRRWTKNDYRCNSHNYKSNPKGVLVYNKDTAYAPAKNESYATLVKK